MKKFICGLLVGYIIMCISEESYNNGYNAAIEIMKSKTIKNSK